MAYDFSAAMKERWQDPGYRERQRAAMAKAQKERNRDRYALKKLLLRETDKACGIDDSITKRWEETIANYQSECTRWSDQ